MKRLVKEIFMAICVWGCAALLCGSSMFFIDDGRRELTFSLLCLFSSLFATEVVYFYFIKKFKSNIETYTSNYVKNKHIGKTITLLAVIFASAIITTIFIKIISISIGDSLSLRGLLIMISLLTGYGMIYLYLPGVFHMFARTDEDDKDIYEYDEEFDE